MENSVSRIRLEPYRQDHLSRSHARLSSGQGDQAGLLGGGEPVTWCELR